MGEEELVEGPEASARRRGCGPVVPRRGRTVTALAQQVFECVRASGRISRRDVARELGVSPGSITHAVAGLIEAGLLVEAPRPVPDAARGRPPVDLAVVAGARHVVGITLGEAGHSAVLTDFCGTVLAAAELRCPHGRRSLETLLDEVDRLLAVLFDGAPLRPEGIDAIGVGIPGFVDHLSGLVHWSPILRDARVDLGEALAAHHRWPVYLDNDVNLLALAEAWFGKGREVADFAVVTLERGVGLGLIAGNALYRGAQGLGTELGHTKVQIDGALCRCGQRGCLEAYVADYALAREAHTALELDDAGQAPARTVEVLFARAKAGDAAAQKIFQRAGRYLAAGLSNVVRLFDPELLLISGARLRYDYLYAEEVLAEMRRLADPVGAPARTRVLINAWGDTVWARGAAALALAAVTDRLSVSR